MKAERFFPALKEATRIYRTKVSRQFGEASGSFDMANLDIDTSLAASFDKHRSTQNTSKSIRTELESLVKNDSI